MNSKDQRTDQQRPAADDSDTAPEAPVRPREIGGPKGPEPTRYGDWERKGRCIDF
ncbi:MAG: DUF1674 domain-containing protein [Gammaproteobacteria bacterium]|nr:DUF1674 domain-containing protein [Gammaproteobacteria bacterium]MCP5201183.1 DUF1674 domain-containing protein [Gammaproteobacteria bacterium]